MLSHTELSKVQIAGGSHLSAVSDTEGSGFRAGGGKGYPFSPLTAGFTFWRSAEDVIQAIYEILLNGEDSTVEMIPDRGIFLLTVRFEGGFQVSDFVFEGIDLHLSLGYPGSCERSVYGFASAFI